MVFTKETIDAIVDNDGALYDVVYLYGSWAAVAARVEDILGAYRGKYPQNSVQHNDGEWFLAETIHTVRMGRRCQLPECDLYVLENIDKVAGRESAEQRLYGILDNQLENKRRILVTGKEPLCNAITLADRINAQVAGGVSFPVE